MDERSVSRDDDAVARTLGLIAVEAGRLLASLTDRCQGQRVKPDGTPTTSADLLSERLILERLADAFPAIPVVAEETIAEAHPDGLFFLVDPLDGTRDYLTGSGEYSVNIALVDGRRPVAAAVAAPDDGRVWIAGHDAHLARIPDSGDAFAWRPSRVRTTPDGGMVALVSRRHGDAATQACMATLPIRENRTASSAYKFCLIAAGEADLYVRCGPTMEWDTAAGDHVLACAGGVVIGPDGLPLVYGGVGTGYRNGPFAALGDPNWAPRVHLPRSATA